MLLQDKNNACCQLSNSFPRLGALQTLSSTYMNPTTSCLSS